ncbi:beta-galactosidase [Prolixibacteraceae bacterium JC049]|nr:beta-galactosidase [Prolixibacteraceae bacterium JC049]
MRSFRSIKTLLLLIAICIGSSLVGIAASKELPKAKSEIVYLTGTDAEHTKTWQFFCSAGMNSQKWTTIEVPSCWEQQKFGAYNYGKKSFKDRLKETGTYRYKFNVPANWKRKHVDIVFEGVMTDATVKINGKQVGATHQGAFYEFSYDVSKFLKYGKENNIEVFVKKFSDDKSINEAERKSDFWVFGGIFRPVYLKAQAKQHIKRVAIDAKANGWFKTHVFTSKLKKADRINVSIATLEGKEMAQFSALATGEMTELSEKVENIKTWNPEDPNLYVAHFSLVEGEKVVHEYSERFGFRTVEVRESDGIYVNGVKVKFKGVNRHTFHPKYARSSSKRMSIEAVELMQEMNMNAVRMSHYPPEKHFLHVCDSLGMMVLDELAGWQRPPYDTEIGRKLTKEMVVRDVNHPCIVLWDNGNENGWNYDLDGDFAKYDIQKREVVHPREDFQKTNTMHYIKYNYLSADGFSKRKIFFPTEFLHGLYDGGIGAGLEDFWHRMWNNPLCAGGFLWVFADEGVARTDWDGKIDLDGNHAADGILGPYLEKEASFYTVKHIWSPVFFENRYVTADFNGVFQIENRYHYTNLSSCTFNVSWMSFNDEVATVLASQKLNVDMAPNRKGTLKIDLAEKWQSADVLKIVLTDKAGKELNTWTWPVKTALQKTNELVASNKQQEVQLEETESNYKVVVGNKSYSFGKNDGMLKSVIHDGKVIPLKDGPVYAGINLKVAKVTAKRNAANEVEIEATFEKVKDFWAKFRDYYKWTIKADGRLYFETAFAPENFQEKVGLAFAFPKEEIESFKWMGQGPFRVWKNRAKGTQFGVWEKSYNETMTGHKGFEYPEFKGYHSEMYWAKVKTKNVPGFKVYTKSNDIYFKMLNPDKAPKNFKTSPKFQKENIGFYHGIPAVGTKFHEASDLGPQGSAYKFQSKNYETGKLHMELIFDFE